MLFSGLTNFNNKKINALMFCLFLFFINSTITDMIMNVIKTCMGNTFVFLRVNNLDLDTSITGHSGDATFSHISPKYGGGEKPYSSTHAANNYWKTTVGNSSKIGKKSIKVGNYLSYNSIVGIIGGVFRAGFLQRQRFYRRDAKCVHGCVCAVMHVFLLSTGDSRWAATVFSACLGPVNATACQGTEIFKGGGERGFCLLICG